MTSHEFLLSRNTVYKQNNKMDCFCEINLLVLGILSFTAKVYGQSECPPGRYRDDGTNTCRHCRHLCEESISQGTELNCRRLCPDYKEETRAQLAPCAKGYYFDRITLKCELCSNLCYKHSLQGTTQECKHMCPTEYESVTSTTNTGNIDEHHINPRPTGATVAVYALCTCMVVLISVSAIMLIVRTRRPYFQYYARVPCCKSRKQDTQEDE